MIMNSVLKGALAGVVSAAAIDFQAFRSWKSIDDVTAYGWRLALFRWGQGAIFGALSAVGFGSILD